MSLFDPFHNDSIKDRSVRSQTAGSIIDAVPANQSSRGMQKTTTPASEFPIQYIPIIAGILLVILLMRVFYLQIVTGSDYRVAAEGNRIETHYTTALRGVVYDADGNLLVKNVPNFTLTVQTRNIQPITEETISQTARDIAVLAKVEQSFVEEQLYSSLENGQPIVVEEHIPYKKALKMMIGVRDIPGADIDVYYSREYLAGEAYGHMLGYTGKLTQEEYESGPEGEYLLTDDIGKTGLEKSYEDALRGDKGYTNIEVDYRGREQNIVAEVPATAGKNIHLSIDPVLQTTLYQELKKIAEENDIPGASAVAIDPRDGSVLALVSYPSYNSNIFAQGVDAKIYEELVNDERQPLFHRSIASQLPSGSVFKPVVAAAALEENVINSQTSFDSTGGIEIDQYYFPDWKAGGHGITNVTKALAESVNTFFYLVGGGDNEELRGLGVDRITGYAKRFGLGAATGIDIFGEKEGFVPSKGWKEEFKNEPWYLGDTYILSIGQGDILVTPLQVAAYTATIANGGKYYTPHIVSYSMDQEGNDKQEIVDEVINEQVVSPESIAIVRQGMKEAVEYGSARSLQSLPVSAAGKTGTAQFGAEDKTHSWFTSFAPYENPEIALTVIIEEGGEGSEAALPVAKIALEKFFAPEESAEETLAEDEKNGEN